MLEAAVAAIHGSEPQVFVVVADGRHAEELRRRLVAMLPASTLAGESVYTEHGRRLDVVTAHAIGLQWATGRHRQFLGIPVYADHCAIEQACGWALDQYAQWDGRAELVAAIGALLSAHGCDCECDHDAEGHDADCERCLGCRIDELLR